MKKYHFFTAFTIPDKNNSGFKLRYDNRQILNNLGYKDCTYYYKQDRNKVVQKAALYLSIAKLIFKKKGDVIVIQYPFDHIFLVKHVLKICSSKGVKLICVVIDVESIRYDPKDKNLMASEIGTFNQFSALIVHNKRMLQWLQENGCKTPMTPIELFDYLANNIDNTGTANLVAAFPYNRIAFAGNLQKSNFINNIPPGATVFFLLYGYLRKQFVASAPNVSWLGEYNPEALLNEIKADWGLIWDGREVSHLDSGLGNYLCFNTPHKTSLYMICGLPVIVPAQAAVAGYILEHKLGIAINKIEDCYTLSITEAAYQTMKENVLKIRGELLQGVFLKRALEDVLINAL